MDEGSVLLLVLLFIAVVSLVVVMAVIMKVRGFFQQRRQRRGAGGEVPIGGGGMLGGVSIWRVISHPIVSRLMGGGGRRAGGGWDANRPDSLPTPQELEAMAQTMRNSAAQRRTTQREGNQSSASSAGVNEEDDQCPVCLETMVSPVELLPCGHHMCAVCLSSMRHHNGGRLRRIACPLDRTPAEALIPAYRYRQQLQQRYNQQIDEVAQRRQDQDLLTYNSSYAHTSTLQGLMSLVRHLPGLVWVLPWAVQARAALTVLGGLLYTISPIDLLPEAVLGLVGLIDDALVVLFVVVVLANIARNAWQIQQR